MGCANFVQDSLRKELDHYNAHRGDRPEISWKEALPVLLEL